MTDYISDDWVTFYLRHQDLIQTWAAVRKDVVDAAHSFYLSLADDLTRLAPSFGEDVAVWVRDGAWSNVGLYRTGWSQDASPLVAAAIEWNTRSTFVDGPRIAGLRVNTDNEAGRALRPHIGDQVRESRENQGFNRRSAMWPAYRDLPRPEEGAYWQDLSKFRSVLIDEVRSVWEAFSVSTDITTSIWRLGGTDPSSGSEFEGQT